MKKALLLFCLVYSTISYSQLETILIKPSKSFSLERFEEELFSNFPEVSTPKYVYSKSKKEGKELRFISLSTSNKLVDEIIQSLQNSSLTNLIELDHWGELSSCGQFNDPGWALQWYLKNDGTRNGAVVGADISACEGWEISKGDSSIIIGFIDSGTKTNHSDLQGRVWKNRNEIPGNNIDDDNNGYVDDVFGWSTYNSTNDISDKIGHGTQINGIVGSNPNNSTGFVGLDWNCKLMNIKGVNDNGQGITSWWAEGIYYLVDNGANVINMSLSNFNGTQILKDAIDYAFSKGVVIVAATGNNNQQNITYPAKYDSVIAVGATDHADERALWSGMGSNYGPEIDFVAPGKAIYGINHVNNSTQYVTAGTSQATPLVTALAGLILSIDSDLSPDSIYSIIKKSSDDQVGRANEDIKGFDYHHGHGRINIYKALHYTDSLKKLQIANINTANPTKNWRFFPNPTTGIIQFEFFDNSVKQVSIYSIFGNKVQSFRNVSSFDVIPLENLTSGVYLISIDDSEHLERIVIL